MRCAVCGRGSLLVAQVLGVCGDCLRSRWGEAEAPVTQAHARVRAEFELPPQPPKVRGGIACPLCAHGCRVSPGEVGYCGLPVDGRTEAHVSWYHDPLPTNCVASFTCPAGTGVGYPRYAHRPGPEYGYTNLAVFYEACSFDCLYCQNWHFRLTTRTGPRHTPEELAAAVDARTACVCFFGGDPGPQLPHALAAAEKALERAQGRILRICWETNGNMAPKLLRRAAELALVSGGLIKFDLKAWSEGVHRALTGASNKPTLANFAWVAEWVPRRPEVPLLLASTLVVPGYVDEKEVAGLARFIAELNPSIPYTLLAFYPQYRMPDLPCTSSRQMELCVEAAREAGLASVHVGNRHLLDALP